MEFTGTNLHFATKEGFQVKNIRLVPITLASLPYKRMRLSRQAARLQCSPLRIPAAPLGGGYRCSARRCPQAEPEDLSPAKQAVRAAGHRQGGHAAEVRRKPGLFHLLLVWGVGDGGGTPGNHRRIYLSQHQQAHALSPGTLYHQGR